MRPDVSLPAFMVFIMVLSPVISIAAVSVVPPSAVMDAGGRSSLNLRYEISSPSRCRRAVSSRGSFVAGKRIIGTNEVTLSVSLAPDPLGLYTAGAVEETVSMSETILNKIEAGKIERLEYRRTFRFSSGCPGSSQDAGVRVMIRHEGSRRLEISRISLYFRNGRPELTVRRDEPVGSVTADLGFNGSGLLRGYWELDGRRIRDVITHLRGRKRIRLSLDGSRGLLSNRPGTHRVGFHIIEPATAVDAPEILYYVTSESGERREAASTGYVPRQVIALFGKDAYDERLIRELSDRYGLTMLKDHEFGMLDYRMVLFETGGNVPDVIRAVGGEATVEHVQTNNILETMSEPMSGMQRIVRELRLGIVHRHLTGEGVAVAVVDTGVDTDHRDLRERISYHEDMMGDGYRAELHGTAVAGLIAAAVNGFGIEGVAPRADIVALRACRQAVRDRPEGVCYTFPIAKALDAAVQKGSRVINMSFGAAHEDAILKRLISKASSMGIILTAPAGNDPATRLPAFPASMPEVVSVGGSGDNVRFYPNEYVASRSDIVLPARGLFTTVPGDRHNFFDGTSMSSALAAGLAALAIQRDATAVKDDLFPFRGDLCQWEERNLGVEACE